MSMADKATSWRRAVSEGPAQPTAFSVHRTSGGTTKHHGHSAAHYNQHHTQQHPRHHTQHQRPGHSHQHHHHHFASAALPVQYFDAAEAKADLDARWDEVQASLGESAQQPHHDQQQQGEASQGQPEQEVAPQGTNSQANTAEGGSAEGSAADDAQHIEQQPGGMPPHVHDFLGRLKALVDGS